MLPVKPLRKMACSLFQDAMQACTVEQAFAERVTLRTGSKSCLLVDGRVVADLSAVKRIRVVAVGKAAAPMLHALVALLRPLPAIHLAGVLIAPEAAPALPSSIQHFAGGHPLPNQASFDGARAALALLHEAAAEDRATLDTLCIFLISGGASAMMELPLDPAITLNDTIAFYRILVHSGASIAEINCVRKHLSAVKGGRLAMAAGSLPSLALLVSDVPAAHLDALGSGPAMADTSTTEECRGIVARYRMLEACPASIRAFFRSPDLARTPKAGEVRVSSHVLLQPEDLANAVADRARSHGFATVIDTVSDDWDYKAAGQYLLDRIRSLRQQHAKICLISVGEVTVEVSASPSHPGSSPYGTGGRNQHLALSVATLLTAADAGLVFLSAGSDGIDGNSLAAGAVVDAGLLSSSATRTEAIDALSRFDSSTFLARHNAVLVTGPTGNNLRDVRILLADASIR